MKTLNRNLIIALVLQVILLSIIIFSITGKNEQQSAILLSSDFSKVDGLTLKSQDSEVNISKENNIWLQADFQSFQVPKNKIDDLLSALPKIKIDFPVATSKDAAKRFNVSQDNAKTIVILKHEGKSTETLYIGSGSGLRKVHARIDGDDKIYSVELPTNLVSTDKNDWIDKSILRAKGEIQSITAKGFSFNLSDGTWKSNIDIAEGKQLNQEAISNWVKQFNTLDISKFISAEKAEKITIQNPVATFSLKTSTQDKATSSDYAFYKDNDKHYVKLFGEPKLFSILNYRAEDILKTDTEGFLENVPDLSNNQQDDIQTIPEEIQALEEKVEVNSDNKKTEE